MKIKFPAVLGSALLAFIIFMIGIMLYTTGREPHDDYAKLPQGYTNTSRATGEIFSKTQRKYWTEINSTAVLNNSNTNDTLDIVIRCPFEGFATRENAEQCLNETLSTDILLVFIDLKGDIEKPKSERFWAFEINRIPKKDGETLLAGTVLLALAGLAFLVTVVACYINNKQIPDEIEMSETEYRKLH